MKLQFGTMLLVIALANSSLVGSADDLPPAGSLNLFDIAKHLEQANYGPLVDVSFDDGNWEVETYKQGVAVELLVDPLTAAVVAEHRDHPEVTLPKDARPLSEIVAKLMDAGYTDVNDVAFEGRNWEVEARRNEVKRELQVDPLTAEVVSDRADD